ncbi:MAG TPA: hypothetical protein VGE92_07955, partial [Steroidobacteraceae bacterium]
MRANCSTPLQPRCGAFVSRTDHRNFGRVVQRIQDRQIALAWYTEDAIHALQAQRVHQDLTARLLSRVVFRCGGV